MQTDAETASPPGLRRRNLKHEFSRCQSERDGGGGGGTAAAAVDFNQGDLIIGATTSKLKANILTN